MKTKNPDSAKAILNKIVTIATILAIVSCSARNENSLKTGLWRGEFTVAGEKVPVNFEVAPDSTGLYKIYLLNGVEKALYTSVTQTNDSIFIPIDDFDSQLILLPEGSSISGFYRKNGSQDRLPFTADYKQTHRFETKSNEPLTDLTGTWDVDVVSDGKPTNKTVGVFEQKNGRLTGTIMTVTGDYRYFEGVLDGDGIYLSAFSGSSPKLIKGKVLDQSNFEAELISAGGKVKLVGKRNEKAALPDAYSLTYLKDPIQKFDFTFPDINGNNVSLHDEKYKGKVVIVTIMGSWCPNCMDEAEFFAPWYKANASRNVKIIGLSFERKDDLDFARGKIEKFKAKYGITYDVLFAGLADKDAASQKLPQINAVLSFPTTFFIDKKGVVRKIHTGFTGPATGKYYEEFVTEFKKEVDDLLSEPSSI